MVSIVVAVVVLSPYFIIRSYALEMQKQDL